MKLQKTMSKRSYIMSAAEEVAAEGKRIAIQMEAKNLADQAARLKKIAARPPPQCKLCKDTHRTHECQKGTAEERREKAHQLRLCQLCVNVANHAPARCRGLRYPEQLCQKRKCLNFPPYSLHHKNLCGLPPRIHQEEEEEEKEEL